MVSVVFGLILAVIVGIWVKQGRMHVDSGPGIAQEDLMDLRLLVPAPAQRPFSF